MNYQSIQKRLAAAQAILHSESIDKATFDSLVQLLTGINPKMDKILIAFSQSFNKFHQVQKGEVIGLIAEAWPDITPEQKKRKKAFLLFWKLWNDLQSEVSRVQKELEKTDAKGGNAASAWGNIFAVVKGPLGVITVIAAGIILLSRSAAQVTVTNNGCEPLSVGTSVSINIPGLKVPREAIVSGQSGQVIVPPLSVTVDMTGSGVSLTAYGAHYAFDTARSGTRVVFDGEELTEKVTTIRLSSQKEHTLDIYCG